MALPLLTGEAGRPSLRLAQPTPIAVRVAVPAVQPVSGEVAAVAFEVRTSWREATSRLLRTIDFPLEAAHETVVFAPAIVGSPAAPALRAAGAVSRPILESAWKPWSTRPLVAPARHAAGYRFVLSKAGFQTGLAAAKALESSLLASPAIPFAVAPPLLPALRTATVLEPAMAELLELRLQAAERQKIEVAQSLPLAAARVVMPQPTASAATALAPAALTPLPVLAAQVQRETSIAPLAGTLQPVVPAFLAGDVTLLPVASFAAPVLGAAPMQPTSISEAAALPLAAAAVTEVRTALHPVQAATSLAPATFAQAPVVVAVAAERIVGDVEALAPAVELPRLPVLRAVPARTALRTEGTLREEAPGLASAAVPMQEMATSAPVPGSVLPSLATLFRYSRGARALRSGSMVFEGVRPRDMAPSRLAFRELPIPIRGPLMPLTSPLRIVETFHYLRPLVEPGVEPLRALLSLWRSVPLYLRFATAAAGLMLLVWMTAPSGAVSGMVASRWGAVRQGIQSRAAVELSEDFRTGLTDWEGDGNQWDRSWAYNPAGYIRPGRLALYQPSLKMRDYRVEFLIQIDRKSVDWVYRAADHLNYYAAKLTIVKPGPLPSLSLVRYPVIGGVQGERVEIPIRMFIHNNTPYRVQLTVQGNGYTTSIEGQIVDFWRDDRFQMGGFGFFSDTGERARVYWMKLSHQDDFIGRVCAYIYENPIYHRRRSGEVYQ